MEETEFEKKLNDQAQNEAGDAEQEQASEPLDPVEKLELEVTQLKDQVLRSRADFDNYRKRMAREMERVRKTAATNLIQDVLPVMDNLELALHHGQKNPEGISEGVNMVYKQFQDILSHNGLSPIAALGELFDPNVHEAISQSPSDEVPHDHIMEEFQRGYKLADQVVRPSKVVVSLGNSDESAAAETTSDNDDEQP